MAGFQHDTASRHGGAHDYDFIARYVHGQFEPLRYPVSSRLYA